MDTTRAIVTEFYKAYAEGNGDRVAALIHDDIDWIIHGPARIFPFEGPRRGKAAVLEVLGAIAEQYELKSYAPELVIVEGDRAAILSNTSFVQRATGRTLRMRLVDFVRVQDGQVVELREFSDTFDVVEQALGSWLEVPAIVA
jgi:ketosteroid isomerase-like protein